MMGIILCIIVITFVSGCTVPGETSDLNEVETNVQIPLIKVDVESIPMINGNTAYGVYRFTDPETRATCYIYTGYKAGGLSCDFKS